jgi:hypothetical protein
MISFDAECSCPIGAAFRAIGLEAASLYVAHEEWHREMSALWERSAGRVDSRAFQSARAAYEEEMFRLLVAAQPESLVCL